MDENANRFWTMIHGICIYMDGFQLQTKDGWFYLWYVVGQT